MGVLGLLVTTVAVIAFCDYTIEKEATNHTYTDISKLPNHKVGLLLGTAKYLQAGGINPYFRHRIDAAVALFKQGKVEYLLVSGDNGHRSYNEPIEFQKELIKNGVPENCIVLDYAGFSTLDSVIRAKEVFGQDNFTIISQEFHNERAIYLAHHHGIHAIGFNAKDLSGTPALKVTLREYLARTKAVLDILRGAKPKFLGDPITIE